MRPLPAVAAVVVAVVLAAGVVLRFIAPTALWLDEAQSVAIARADLPGLYRGLRADGAPPLYYVLLHGWTAVFGDGTFTVRALSGLFGVAALPVAWLLGTRLGGRRAGLALVLLLATNPFAVRYGSETRMYSLVVLLVLLALLAAGWVWRRPGPLPVAALAVSAAALLYTHYWALYVVGTGGLVALAALRVDRRAALRLLGALVVAALAFLPWVPTMLWQAAHTGSPWAVPGGLRALQDALNGWQGGDGVRAVLFGWLMLLLVAAALTAVPDGRGARLGASPDPRRWVLLALSAGTLVAAGLASLVTSSAVVARYTSVALPAFLALVALGVGALPGARTRLVALGLCLAAGLSVAVSAAGGERTQAAQVATALRDADPGDVVAFCPDQLGPAVDRLAPAGLDLVVYPDLRPADRVDWTDYARRNTGADPTAVAAAVSARAGTHAVYVVTGPGFRVPSDRTCGEFRTALADLRGTPQQVVARDGAAGDMRMHRFGPAAG